MEAELQEYQDWLDNKVKIVPKQPMAMIEVNAPRWKGRTVGIASYKIQAHNRIRITAANKDGKRYFPHDLYMSGEDIRKHETQLLPAGTVLYLVPIKEFEVLED